MALSKPVSRRHRHTRKILCEGYLRDDGLWDIEGRIVDTKPYVYTEPYRGRRAPDSEVHDMSIRLTIDDTLVVHGIEIDMAATPYPSCVGAKPNFDRLVGACIGRGWRRAVTDAVGGTQGCTHVRELLFPMATVAFQTVFGWPEDGPDGPPPQPVAAGEDRPHFIDGCHAWRSDGEVVAQFYPRFSRRR
jgi:hypothetical protein